MLFASTRATVTRELGTEKFTSSVFATEESEILDEKAWRERDNEGPKAVSREDLMSEKERELEAVRKAEAEARNGTSGIDIGMGGTLGPRAGTRMRVTMPADEAATTALRDLQEGGLVQLVCVMGYYLRRMDWDSKLTFKRQLTFPRRRSFWPTPSLESMRTPSPLIFHPLLLGTPSTITQDPMS